MLSILCCPSAVVFPSHARTYHLLPYCGIIMDRAAAEQRLADVPINRITTGDGPHHSPVPPELDVDYTETELGAPIVFEEPGIVTFTVRNPLAAAPFKGVRAPETAKAACILYEFNLLHKFQMVVETPDKRKRVLRPTDDLGTVPSGSTIHMFYVESARAGAAGCPGPLVGIETMLRSHDAKFENPGVIVCSLYAVGPRGYGPSMRVIIESPWLQSGGDKRYPMDGSGTYEDIEVMGRSLSNERWGNSACIVPAVWKACVDGHGRAGGVECLRFNAAKINMRNAYLSRWALEPMVLADMPTAPRWVSHAGDAERAFEPEIPQPYRGPGPQPHWSVPASSSSDPAPVPPLSTRSNPGP